MGFCIILLGLLRQSNTNAHSPVAVNEGVEQVADGDGHQGEHEHPRPRRRAHCADRLGRAHWLGENMQDFFLRNNCPAGNNSHVRT